jgi:DNA-binding GntR family transcriptional regulator
MTKEAGEIGLAENVDVADSGRRVPATERVLDFILSEMDHGRLAPGGRVNAARIASTLQLSAAPVREALSVLAGRGVLDLLPDRGAVMRPFLPNEVIQLWALIGPIGGVGVRLAGEAIANGADGSELDRLYERIVKQSRANGPLEFILSLNEWHYAANRIGGNPFVTEALDRLGIPYWDRYLVKLIDVPAHIGGYLENYRRLHDAVMAGDGRAAAAIVQFHADWSIELVREAAEKSGTRRRRRQPSG